MTKTTITKRSDFPCPGIIHNRSTMQAGQSRKIADHFAEKLDRRNAPVARQRNRDNEDFLAGKRRKVAKGRMM